MRIKQRVCENCGYVYSFTGPLKNTVCPECGEKPKCTGSNYKQMGYRSTSER